jgi:hypothetical protein
MNKKEDIQIHIQEIGKENGKKNTNKQNLKTTTMRFLSHLHLHDVGKSFCKSLSSLRIFLEAMCNGSKTTMTTLPFTLKHNTPTKAPNKQNRKKIPNIKLNNQTSKNV